MARNAEGPPGAPSEAEPVTIFRVVKEPHGWSVRLNGSMMTPFTSRELATEHACHYAEKLRSAGRAAEVTIDQNGSSESPP